MMKVFCLFKILKKSKIYRNFISILFTETANNAGEAEEVPCPLRAPLIVTIVGLPCRGKSLAAHKIARHLCWKGEGAKGNFLLNTYCQYLYFTPTSLVYALSCLLELIFKQIIIHFLFFLCL